jgi:transcriptional regulator with XRE-family HTH domain
MTEQSPRISREVEDAAALQGMAQAVIVTREQQGMSREQLAEKCELGPAELETVECGNTDDLWAVIRRIAKGLGMSPAALFTAAENFAPGPGGEAWRRSTREAEADSAVRGPRNDAGEGRQP